MRILSEEGVMVLICGESGTIGLEKTLQLCDTFGERAGRAKGNGGPHRSTRYGTTLRSHSLEYRLLDSWTFCPLSLFFSGLP